MNKVMFLNVVAMLAVLLQSNLVQADPCTKVEPYLNKSEYRLAEGAARTCLEKFPNHVRVWYLLSQALAGQKRYTDALKWTDKAIDKYPGDKDLHIWRVRLIAWSGDLDKAWSERFRIIKAAQHRRDAAMLIADVAFWREDCIEAVKWYNRIIKKWPNAERAKANRDKCSTLPDDFNDIGESPIKKMIPKKKPVIKERAPKEPVVAKSKSSDDKDNYKPWELAQCKQNLKDCMSRLGSLETTLNKKQSVQPTQPKLSPDIKVCAGLFLASQRAKTWVEAVKQCSTMNGRRR